MPWPQSQDYNEAVQNPRHCFEDADLAAASPAANAMGIPMPRSGNFADVYQLKAGPRSWAVKCFTREVPGLRERYRAVSDHLSRVRPRFAVDFRYLDRGIRVAGVVYPVLKMDWIAGRTLNEAVRESLDDPRALAALADKWLALGDDLRAAQMAHGDLQHGNVLVSAGGDLRLIDYDGLWVPALDGDPPGEVGHPAYQHPARLKDGPAFYGPAMDRFSELAIAVALRALACPEGGRRLWDRYDNGDNLLFREDDFSAPDRSPLMQELWGMKDPAVRAAAGRLILSATGGPRDIPEAADAPARPLSADEERRLAALMRSGASAVRPVPRMAPAAMVASTGGSMVPWWAAAPVTVSAATPTFTATPQTTYALAPVSAPVAPTVSAVTSVAPVPQPPVTVPVPVRQARPSRVRRWFRGLWEKARAELLFWSLALLTGAMLLTQFGDFGATARRSVQELPPEIPGEYRRLRAHIQSAKGVAFAPDGRTFACVGSDGTDGTVRLWEMTPILREVRRFEMPGSPWCVAFSPDGSRVAAGNGAGLLRVWNAADGQVLFERPAHAGAISGVAVTADGRVITSGFDGGVAVWVLDTGMPLRSMPSPSPNRPVRCLAVSPDGETIAAGMAPTAGTHGVVLLNARTLAETGRLPGLSGMALSLAFSPDGKRLATAGDEQRVRVWDVRSRRELAALPDHYKPARAAAFLPDGRRLLTADSQRVIRLWDTETGAELSRWESPETGVNALAVSRDGRFALSAGSDGAVCLWRLP